MSTIILKETSLPLFRYSQCTVIALLKIIVIFIPFVPGLLLNATEFLAKTIHFQEKGDSQTLKPVQISTKCKQKFCSGESVSVLYNLKMEFVN